MYSFLFFIQVYMNLDINEGNHYAEIKWGWILQNL